jgi:TM2 domain-containing membrane protein YozV
MQTPGADKKMPAGIFAILLGAFGVHKFYLGNTTEGIIMLAITVFTCGTVSSIIGLVEGIIYLSMADDVFVQTYISNKKGWF